MGPTGDIARILQIHPTRRCNLRCLHCYSSSGPDQHEELDADLLCEALKDASTEGYTVASFSGGEPVLYGPLRMLLEQAQRSGMITAVVSNGMLLDDRRLAMLSGATDLLAISLDGLPASHNRMRASNRAFETMQSRLAAVRKANIPFGFIFTLTQHNLHELNWVAQFASEEGAKLLQIHPLEEVGRARHLLKGEQPDPTESAYAYFELLRIQALFGEKMKVQLDLADRDAVRLEPGRVYADDVDATPLTAPLADLVSPLVIESDGTVVPIQHGFGRPYALGNLHDASLRVLSADWRDHGYVEFRSLAHRVFHEVTQTNGLPFFNWYQVIGRESNVGRDVRTLPLSLVS